MYRRALSLALGWAALASAQAIQETYDVAVIGGGASGAYAAVRLQQQGIKAVVIERNNRLGGHVNTYKTSAGTFDYGVQIFSNISVVTDFFARYNIPLIAPGGLGANSQTVDFNSGTPIPGAANTSALAQGLLAYAEQVAKWPTIAEVWDIPSPVPEDFTLSVGDFITKYSLQNWAYIAYTYQQGLGNILAQSTLYVLKYFDNQQVTDIATQGFLVNGLQNNQALYDAVLAELGDNVLLNTQATSIKRDGELVQIAATSESGCTYEISAKKLLVAIPPTAEKLSFLDLSDQEKSIFGQFNGSYYWNSIVTNSGLPDNVTFTNIDPVAPNAIPAVPGLYTINSTPFPGVISPLYGSPTDLSDDAVKADIVATIKRIRAGLNITVDTEPEFVEFNAHNPFHLTVPNDAILAGFYDDLEALQGQKNTWFTGGTWNKPATSALWNFTENVILPGLLADLKA